jgi:hypothetical protein
MTQLICQFNQYQEGFEFSLNYLACTLQPCPVAPSVALMHYSPFFTEITEI